VWNIYECYGQYGSIVCIINDFCVVDNLGLVDIVYVRENGIYGRYHIYSMSDMRNSYDMFSS